jgi:tetratricopeptide (TPR) repeat protein
MSTNQGIPSEFGSDRQQAESSERRYLATGDRSALDAAAAAWERILGSSSFTSASEQFQLAAMNDAGGVFLRRYWSGGRIADLDRALLLLQQAVRLTPPDSPAHVSILNNLGTGLRDRYALSGQLADLEAAIASWQQAVQLTLPDSPHRASRLNNLI